MQNVSVLSWNIQGKVNITGYTFFNKVKSHLISYSPDIIALQEMCDAEKILKNIQAFKKYNMFIPKFNRGGDSRNPGFNHNVLLIKYPILRADEITFPQWNQNAPLENCTRADIQLNNQVLRIYNCHFAIFKVGIATRLKQLEYILSDSRSHKGPIIICGDMNVTIPKMGWNRKVIARWHQEPAQEMSINGTLIDYDERELFDKTISQYGFEEVLDLYTPTWSPFKSKIWEMFKLKLDWFMVKNVEVTNVKLGDYVSDHRPIEVQCRL